MRFSGTCLKVALVSVMAFSLPAAAAETRPHLSRGVAHFVSANFDFVGSGYATHLGRYTETGIVAFSPTSNPAVLHVDGSAVYVAADGAELHAAIVGELNQQTGVIGATLTYVGGTGRLANASGTAALAGQVLPDGTLSVSVAGDIAY
jgi:hypothetical protein